jgi:hypothetical protein
MNVSPVVQIPLWWRPRITFCPILCLPQATSQLQLEAPHTSTGAVLQQVPAHAPRLLQHAFLVLGPRCLAGLLGPALVQSHFGALLEPLAWGRARHATVFVIDINHAMFDTNNSVNLEVSDVNRLEPLDRAKVLARHNKVFHARENLISFLLQQHAHYLLAGLHQITFILSGDHREYVLGRCAALDATDNTTTVGSLPSWGGGFIGNFVLEVNMTPLRGAAVLANTTLVPTATTVSIGAAAAEVCAIG